MTNQEPVSSAKERIVVSYRLQFIIIEVPVPLDVPPELAALPQWLPAPGCWDGPLFDSPAQACAAPPAGTTDILCTPSAAEAEMVLRELADHGEVRGGGGNDEREDEFVNEAGETWEDGAGRPLRAVDSLPSEASAVQCGTGPVAAPGPEARLAELVWRRNLGLDTPAHGGSRMPSPRASRAARRPRRGPGRTGGAGPSAAPGRPRGPEGGCLLETRRRRQCFGLLPCVVIVYLFFGGAVVRSGATDSITVVPSFAGSLSRDLRKDTKAYQHDVAVPKTIDEKVTPVHPPALPGLAGDMRMLREECWRHDRDGDGLITPVELREWLDVDVDEQLCAQYDLKQEFPLQRGRG